MKRNKMKRVLKSEEKNTNSFSTKSLPSINDGVRKHTSKLTAKNILMAIKETTDKLLF